MRGGQSVAICIAIASIANAITIKVGLSRIGNQRAIVGVVIESVAISIQTDAPGAGAIIVTGGIHILGRAGQQPLYLGKREAGILRPQQRHGAAHVWRRRRCTGKTGGKRGLNPVRR